MAIVRGWDHNKSEATKGAGDRLKLEPGQKTMIRIIDDLETEAAGVYEHWVVIEEEDDNGKVTKEKRLVYCPGEDVCPLCAAGNAARYSFHFTVLDYGKDGKDAPVVKYMKGSKTFVREQLTPYVDEEEYKSKFADWTFRLIAEAAGKGKFAHIAYQLVPLKVRPMTAEEKELRKIDWDLRIILQKPKAIEAIIAKIVEE